MGRKKKFIDKKNSSTFQLIARDSSDPNYDDSPGGDRVFIQVSGRPNEDPDSIFADADEDGGQYYYDQAFGNSAAAQPLPEKLRKEILDLGFPDDGYNYLNHLRDIKNTGGGSAYYSNPKAKLEQLPHDVKAYDASRLPISVNESPDENAIYNVASKTVNVTVQKAVDPEVSALLDESDALRFGSDVEDLEEDFVVKANLPDEDEEEDVCNGEGPNFGAQSENKNASNEIDVVRKNCIERENGDVAVDDPRARRDVDEEFDMVLSREYDNDYDEDDDDNDGDNHYGYRDEEDEPIEEKLKHVKLNECVKDDFELNGYEVPGDDEEKQKTKELGKMYEDEHQEDVVVVVEEQSDDSEQWDCETVITTYSNLQNHPVKIGENLIKLGGKQKLPVDFLPRNRRPAATERAEGIGDFLPRNRRPAATERAGGIGDFLPRNRRPAATERAGGIGDFLSRNRRPAATERAEGIGDLKTEQPKSRQHGQESKEEKKERKAAVKEERREARRAKKEMKELYKGEAQHAQRVAAISGPSSRRLM